MGYLATSNTTTPVVVPTPKATQYGYLQTAATGTFSGYANWSKTALTVSSTAGINTADTLLTTATNSTAGVSLPAVVIPQTGLWSLVWSARFNSASAENNACFHVISSKTYGETGSTGGSGVRLGVTSTSAYNTTVSWTGYAQAGDQFGLSAYTSGTGNSLQPGANLGGALYVTLLQATT